MYPTVRYHRTLQPVLVNDPLEDEQLGPDWADSPAAFAEVAEEDADPPAEEPASDEPKKSRKGKK